MRSLQETLLVRYDVNVAGPDLGDWMVGGFPACRNKGSAPEGPQPIVGLPQLQWDPSVCVSGRIGSSRQMRPLQPNLNQELRPQKAQGATEGGPVGCPRAEVECWPAHTERIS